MHGRSTHPFAIAQERAPPRRSGAVLARSVLVLSLGGGCGIAASPLQCLHVESRLDGEVGTGCGASGRVYLTSPADSCLVDLSGTDAGGLPRSGALTGTGDHPLGRLAFVLFEGTRRCTPESRAGNTITITCSDPSPCTTTLQVTAEQ